MAGFAVTTEGQQDGLLGIIEDKPRSGRPRHISPKKEAEIVEPPRFTKPKNANHWTVRTMAREQGVSPSASDRKGKNEVLRLLSS
jgi:hypothetical protein